MAIKKADVKNVIAFLEENRTRNTEVTLNDVIKLAEVMASSIRDLVHSTSPSITDEFSAISFEIKRMKDEIGRLRVSDMKHNRIPEAGRELDAIVTSTEEATNTIMESAEAIMAADTSDAEAYQAEVTKQVMEIFEACAFQDITGQRISKVVNTLNFIDQRVSKFIEEMRLAQEQEEHQHEETPEERRARELILHGPQHNGEGVSQDDIDALLNGDDKGGDSGSSQDDIDKLFP
ncbi:protein phosphatase CheZ [Pseudovibrio exalbescens]|uniref:protein phosphatase CheZ n=1 Tax=Pseudovibrio exalbescens TaxID=197461 RepID=UPI000411661F|nr:protein phosphatase CheZ [Pseudovibrio exalbescens]